MASERDRLLAATRALGFPVSDALATAPLAEVRGAVRQLAEADLATVDVQTVSLERERALLAALLTDTPTGHA